MSEHAEVGGARKPGEGPQSPEKARKIRRRPRKKFESVLFGDVRRANPHPWLLVMPVLLLMLVMPVNW